MSDKPWESDESFLGRWIDGKLTPEELSTFETSPDFEDFRNLIIATQGIKGPKYDVESHLKNVNGAKRNQKKSKVVNFKSWYQVAAAACLVLVVAYFALFFGQVSVRTESGEQMSLLLPDSSKVILNSASSLAYSENNWEEDRTLKLSGEAYFEVQEGSTFTVEVENGVVTVVGTSFNVRSRKDRFDVTCYSGKVKVASGEIQSDIAAGETISILQGKIIDKGSHEQDNPNWTKGTTRLVNVSAQEALDELQRVFDIKISRPELLPDETFTGTFPHADVELAIKLVLETLNIEYSYNSTERLLTIKP